MNLAKISFSSTPAVPVKTINSTMSLEALTARSEQMQTFSDIFKECVYDGAEFCRPKPPEKPSGIVGAIIKAITDPVNNKFPRTTTSNSSSVKSLINGLIDKVKTAPDCVAELAKSCGIADNPLAIVLENAIIKASKKI